MSEQDKVFYQYNGNSLAVEDWDSRREVSFDDLVQAVKVTHSATQAGAVKAMNLNLCENARQLQSNNIVRKHALQG
jgi:hypothetical protein